MRILIYIRLPFIHKENVNETKQNKVYILERRSQRMYVFGPAPNILGAHLKYEWRITHLHTQNILKLQRQSNKIFY